ncbi:MAG: NADH-quinone oxidoreductase subunit A [Bradymonadales bacterium]|nr:NADH-quinone oxidoreductase subunit A [Bradymonadales bacterium]
MDWDYLAIGVLVVAGGGLAFLLVYLSHVLGPRGENRWKRDIFECGSVPLGSARSRFSVKFYLVAILFILFDIEAVFVIPWAVLFRSLGLAGLIEMFVFLGILLVGLVYVWRKGGLEWG